jgi:hypothetical protein
MQSVLFSLSGPFFLITGGVLVILGLLIVLINRSKSNLAYGSGWVFFALGAGLVAAKGIMWINDINLSEPLISYLKIGVIVVGCLCLFAGLMLLWGSPYDSREDILSRRKYGALLTVIGLAAGGWATYSLVNPPPERKQPSQSLNDWVHDTDQKVDQFEKDSSKVQSKLHNYVNKHGNNSP